MRIFVGLLILGAGAAGIQAGFLAVRRFMRAVDKAIDSFHLPIGH